MIFKMGGCNPIYRDMNKKFVLFGLFIFVIGYWLGIANIQVNYFRKSSGESILYISGKNSFITIDIRDKKTKQILYQE
jgi:hypothetical protein